MVSWPSCCGFVWPAIVAETMPLWLTETLVAVGGMVIVGVSSAFLGGIWDELLSLLTNVFLVIPALPLLIVLLGYLQTKGQDATILVLSGLGWPWGARVIRAQTLAIRNRDYIAAAQETGEKSWRGIAFEIVPGVTAATGAAASTREASFFAPFSWTAIGVS